MSHSQDRDFPLDPRRSAHDAEHDGSNHADTASSSACENLSLYSQASVPLEYGDFDILVYHNQHGEESIVIKKGNFADLGLQESVFARIHSECFTGEALGSLKCDCKPQLDLALKTIANEGLGLVIYLRQEGRGIGLGNKIKAYELQNSGLNTIEANLKLGFASDLRDFSPAAKILNDLGIKRIKLNTNNPDKEAQMKAAGIEVETLIPSLAPVGPHNESYLMTKLDRMGHFLSDSFPKVR